MTATVGLRMVLPEIVAADEPSVPTAVLPLVCAAVPSPSPAASERAVRLALAPVPIAFAMAVS